MQIKKLSLIVSLILISGAFTLKAASGTWTNDASGNWSGTANWLNAIVADASGSTADFSTINLTANRTVTFDAVHTLTTLKFGDAMPDFNWTLSGANTLTLAGTTPTITVLNQNATISSVIAGTVGMTKAGAGTLTLGGVTDTFTGGLIVNAGTLTLDYNASGSPVSTLVPSQVLTLAGGTLNINGNAGAATSQGFSSITLNPGLSIISAAPASGANNPTVSLGGWTANRGALVRFIGPATIGVGNVSVPATATITTTTVGSGAASFGILLGEGPAVANPTAAFGTVGLYDWASTSLANGTAGTSPYTIIGGSQVAGFYSTGWAASANLDVTTNGITIVNNSLVSSIRFNSNSAPTIASGGGGNLLFFGLLVTPNVGANNASITGNGTWQVTRITNPNGAQTGAIWQNNTLGYFIMTPVIADGREGSSDAVQVAKGGDGTVTLTSGSTYTGTTYVNGGNLLITANTCLGSAASGTTAQLNGGAIVGDGGSFALDNGGSTPKRGITLLGNGGGLAATTGNTLTIDGVVAGANGTGPLIIGIPASSANGNVAGLLPGSGSIANGQAVDTANPTAVFGNGTVVLNFPNGASGNTFFGGVNIVGGATLNINSQYALGGANQGPTVFNGGTLQYNSTLATGAAGTALDISGQPVTFTGNATIDLNSQTVTYASAIGKSGSGTLTVVDSIGGGGLTLTGGTYTNTTTVGNGVNAVTLKVNGSLASRSVAVTSGATFGSTGTVAGNVTWSSGAIASFTSGSLMTVSGTATLNNNNVTINVAGAALTPVGSPFTLMTATSIAGGSSVISVPTVTGSGIAPGYTGVVSISGNSVILTVSGSSTIATWTDGNATEKWSQAGNWSGGLPQVAGDLASFGTGGVGLPVILDANETVGVVSFNNASSYTINGTNALTMDNSANGASITVTAGTANTINPAISLNDNLTATAASGTLVTLGGTVTNASVAKTLTATGGGTVVLSQANSYGPSAGSVGTTLGGATLRVGNSAALAAGDVSVTANSTLQAGAAGLNLANNASVDSVKILTVDDNGTTFTLGGNISGAGAVTKIGNGTLALAGNNSYSGNTTVNAGVLSLSSAANSGSSTIVLNGGDLLGNGTFAMANNIGVGPATGATPGTALIDAASGQTFEVDGIIASAGNTGANNLTINALASAPGMVVLGGVNTFKGTTTISNSVLQLANALALQASTLNYNNQGGSLSFGTLTAATLGALTGSQNLSLLNTTPAGVALTVANTSTSTYAGGLSGTGGSLTKAGAGTFILTGTNNFSGSTTVSAGVLQINSAGVITNGSAANVFANGAAQLAVSGGSFTAGSLAIANPSVGMLVSSGSAVINGNLTLNNGNAASDSLIAVTGGSLTATNLTIGRSSVSTGTQPTTGDTTRGLYINGGTVNVINNLVVGAANANSAVSSRMDSGSLVVGGSVTIGLNNGGRWAVLDINGGNFTVNDTTTGVSLGQSVAGNAELIVRNGTATLGKISMGQGSTVETAVLSLANLGSLYVGIGGIEQVSSGVGFVSIVTLGDGTLGHGTLGATGDWMSSLPMTLAGATIKAADVVNNPHNITLNGSLSGTTLTKTGNGTLTLSAANTYTGPTTINAGTLALSGSGAIDASPLISVAGGAVLDVSGLGSGLTLTSGQVLSNSASAKGIISGNLNTGNGTVSITYASSTPSFTVTNGTFTLASGTTFNVNNTGAALAQGSYKLISTNLNGSGFVSGGTLPAVTVAGNGVSGAGTPTLQINNSELYLVVASGVNTNPTNITAVVAGNTLSLTWPGDHLGWTLQTNSVSLANTNFWFPYPGSASVTNVNITINPAKANVFFRLVYP